MASIILALSAPVAASPLDGAQQLVVVTPDADGWNAKRATLQRWQRADNGWRAVGDAVPVALGAGLAWGVGVTPMAEQANEPVKKEGDRRSPAGVFALTEVTGLAEIVTTGLPYRQATAELRCVDDVESASYNTVTTTGNWKSAEEMRIDAYRLAVFVAHNPARTPGAGSCIFLHLGARTTVGCTVMAMPALEALVAWLKPGALLVQLPRQIYRRERQALNAP